MVYMPNEQSYPEQKCRPQRRPRSNCDIAKPLPHRAGSNKAQICSQARRLEKPQRSLGHYKNLRASSRPGSHEIHSKQNHPKEDPTIQVTIHATSGPQHPYQFRPRCYQTTDRVYCRRQHLHSDAKRPRSIYSVETKPGAV